MRNFDVSLPSPISVFLHLSQNASKYDKKFVFNRSRFIKLTNDISGVCWFSYFLGHLWWIPFFLLPGVYQSDNFDFPIILAKSKKMKKISPLYFLQNCLNFTKMMLVFIISQKITRFQVQSGLKLFKPRTFSSI